MSNNSTLVSRLRVLIAKAFRAEKLYCCIRTSQGLEAANVSEIANDLRAKEWQRAHLQLRSLLNEALSAGGNSELTAQISLLYQRFHRLAEEAVEVAKQEREKLIETLKREEFAHTLKISLELVRLKARGQAYKAVADEVLSALQTSGKVALEAEGAEVDLPEMEEEAASERMIVNSNVIPFRRFQRRL